MTAAFSQRGSSRGAIEMRPSSVREPMPLGRPDDMRYARQPAEEEGSETRGNEERGREEDCRARHALPYI